MNFKKTFPSIYLMLMLNICTMVAFGQTLKLKNQEFELKNVTGSIIKFHGQKVLKIERDLQAFPFDINRLEATVDDIHYARLLNLDDFENGTIEVKMYSQLQNPAPYPGIAGFIGVYFRITENDSAWESIYVRPKVGRVDNQRFRNHAVQYFPIQASSLIHYEK